MLGEGLIGVYLQGSFALGAADVHSDVDFVVVTRKRLRHRELERLQEMHERVFDLSSHWARVLEGSYFPEPVIRDLGRRGEALWYLDNGARQLVRSSHCNTAIVRHIVRERGIVLTGPDPRTLVGPVPHSVLEAEIRATMDAWGREIDEKPARYANRFYQGFIVLSYCRMWCDLVLGEPGSKRRGAAWARAHVDPEWVDLIERAWATREDPATAVRTPADPADFERTLAFVRWVLEHRDPSAPSDESR